MVKKSLKNELNENSDKNLVENEWNQIVTHDNKSENLDQRHSRIEKIRQSHADFEREIKVLKSNPTQVPQEKYSADIGEDKLEKSQSVQLGHELSDVIEKYVIDKLEILGHLYDTENNKSRQLNHILQQKIKKIIVTEERLREKLAYLESEVKSKTKKLNQAERLSAIGELASKLAHDLRNPLTVIKGTVEIVKVKSKDGQAVFSPEQIRMMERGINRMSNQIEDVLDFVKVQTLRTSYNSILDTIKLSTEKIKITEDLEIILPKNDINFVYDADKIEVILDNLLTNAHQAIDGKGRIRIRVAEFENDVVLDVEDSGSGIPDENIEKIFEPLFTTKQRGTGLGLASCRSIIEQHGGSLYVKNNPTTMVVKLPKTLTITSMK